MNAVDAEYDRAVVDLGISDQERSMEDLRVYVFGHNDTSNSIDIFIVNQAPLLTNITRVWVMRTDLQKTLIFNSTNLPILPLSIQASAQVTIEGLDLSDILVENEEENYFIVGIASHRGKKYLCELGPIHKTPDGWSNGILDFQIQVIILSDWAHDDYKIEVFGADDDTEGFYNYIQTYQHHGDFFTVIQVPQPGAYNLSVWRKESQEFTYSVGNSTCVLTWIHPLGLRKFEDL